MPLDICTQITGKQIANLMCSAIESGDPVTTASKGGWCAGIFYKTKRHTPPGGCWYYDKPDWYESDDFQIEIHEVDDERTGHITRHTVRRAELVKGLEAMMRAFPDQFGQIMRDDTDAPCADALLQSICFGKEKYA